MLAAPGSEGHDAELAIVARRFDRQFHSLNAFATGGHNDVYIADGEETRAALDRFLLETDGWDFEEETGVSVGDAIVSWGTSPGAYAGVGIVADAYRYGTLRDQGASCEEVQRARAHLEKDLDLLHMAVAITGAPGVIARGLARNDLVGSVGMTRATIPLFDEDGNPLPEEKNNGEFREDNSGGLYPEYVWEDSCSRDQIIGWVMGMAAAWEVVGLDPTFDDALKSRLQSDAAAIARSLMEVGERGYDLEIHDADGRITYHGNLNENAVDRVYLDHAENGQHAAMALGMLAALAYVSEADDVREYVHDELIWRRQLDEMVRDRVGVIDFGAKSNYSNYNMAFGGVWLAHRYLCDPEAREAVRQGIAVELYERAGRGRQPVEQGMTLYDFVHATAQGGATAWTGVGEGFDGAAFARGLETLRQFPTPPHLNEGVENCDATEIEAGFCMAVDGETRIELLGYEGRNEELVSVAPLPMKVRPRSNYYWRSNPYEVNGDPDPRRLNAGSDFRATYWMARWIRREP